MKKIVLYLLMIMQALTVTACHKDELDLGFGTVTPDEDTRVLIVYYSWSGTTRGVAERMQRMLHCDIYEVVPAVPYPSNGDETHYRAVEERESGNLPELRGALPDLSKYEVILIGGPVWSDYMATPLMSYMAQSDFTGKRVAGFRTDAGTPGRYDSEFRRMAVESHADVAKEVLGLSHVRSMNAGRLDSRITSWFVTVGAVNKVPDSTAKE
jgi:flavodoxin